MCEKILPFTLVPLGSVWVLANEVKRKEGEEVREPDIGLSRSTGHFA
jgi:hypothetical protein